MNIKVRQPLQQIMIPAVSESQKAHVEAVKDLIMNEVNVKDIRFVEGEDILVKSVKCNFRTMGKKYGKLMKGVAARINSLDQHEISELEKNGHLTIDVEGQQLVIDATDVDIISEDIPGWLVSNEGNLTVALEVELNDELVKEGTARELINRIQNLRKDSGLEITDRIKVTIAPDENINSAIEAYSDYIKGQVLADEIVIAENDGVIDKFDVNITIDKI